MARKNNMVDPAKGLYKQVPSLAAYIERIGAEEQNFRKFMVKEYKGHYYSEKSFIQIITEPKFEIKCSKKEHAPTKDELKAIEEELPAIAKKWPRSVLARNTDALRAVTKGELYEFHSRNGTKDGSIIMVQERIKFPDGSKAFLPWAYFSDGMWRQMEPDGKLPFWKPKERRKVAGSKSAYINKIMVHEGAKTAKYVDHLVNDSSMKDELDKHPWRDTLVQYEHWGMIGGALSPQRTLYSEIKSERPMEVLYVCDNDHAGKSVITTFSQYYMETLKAVMFDDRFPYAFDLSDEMPKHLFNSLGRYKGPSLESLTVAATWATETVAGPKGRPAMRVTSTFREEWFHSVKPEVFVHRDRPSNMLLREQFNSQVSPFSGSPSTALLLQKDAVGKTGVIHYSPDKPSGIYADAAIGRYINTHVKSSINPEKGDPSPFLKYLDHLVPVEEDRHQLMRWIATLLACPSIKMKYGVLLISEMQGVGKGTLGEKILKPLVGDLNVSIPSEDEITDSNFNYWIAHKRLAIIHEIYAGHSAKAYNRLKSVITEDYMTVKKKYMDNYEIKNWVHVFACSNSKRALQLSHDDRRWFVPKVTETKQPPKFWVFFNDWLEDKGGLGIIQQWAIDFIDKHGSVGPGDDSPWSAVKKEIVEEGYSPGQLLVAQALTRVAEEAENPDWVEAQCKADDYTGKDWKKKYGKQVLIIDTDLQKLIKNLIYNGNPNDRLEKPLTLRKIAKANGMFINEHRASIDAWGTRSSVSRLIVTDKELEKVKPIDLAKTHKPIDILALAAEWGM